MPINDVGLAWLQKGAQYAVDVREGKIATCNYVKLAVDRWFNDLETGHKRGLCFDESAAARYFRFVARYCRHSEGEWAGKRVVFEPWQCFIEMNIHGWMNEDGTRRFRISYEEVARKNGKTLRLGADGNYYLIGDNEPGAQVYSAATKRDQAREIFEAALAMVRQDRHLSSVLKGEEHKIKPVSGRGKFLPLSKDSKRMDGFNVHAGLIDEYHAHPDASIFNVVRSGTGARRQPIMRLITTAGFDRRSACYEQRQYAIKILEGTVENDSYFAMIYTIDGLDDNPDLWEDEREWIKANPNLGVSVSLKQLRDQAKEAKEIPDQRVEFLTKRLNIWTYGIKTWMPMEKWHACKVEYDAVSPMQEIGELGEFAASECYGGLDLASVEDMCSFTLVFPWGEDGKKRRVLHRSYLPQAALERRLRKGDATLEKFRDGGWLVVLPGEVVNYDFIKEDIKRACERFDIKYIAFDRHNSSQLVQDLLAEEIPMVQFGQGYYSMSAPTKEVMRRALVGDIEHNDKLLSWAISNVVTLKDPAGSIKPDKSKVSEKIDPAVALIMAIGVAMSDQSDNHESIYNTTTL